MPADTLCPYCHHLLTRHYNAGDVEATGCGQLGCPCLHSSRGPGLTPAEAALVPPRVRSTVVTLDAFPLEVVAPTVDDQQGPTLWSRRAVDAWHSHDWHQHYQHTYYRTTDQP